MTRAKLKHGLKINREFMNTDDIDFVLTLHPHGWSTCTIYVGDKKTELTITHVFGDPYSDFVGSLSKLIDKKTETTFFWYSEPGGSRIEITRIRDRQNVINIKVDSFSESFGDEVKTYERVVDFEIKETAFVILSYFQLKKIKCLLQEPSYAKERQGEFPFREFNDFEIRAKEYIELKRV